MDVNGRILADYELIVKNKGYKLRRKGTTKARIYFKVNCKRAIVLFGNKLKCQRCLTEFSKAQGELAVQELYYCPYCLMFGRLTSHNFLYTIPWHSPFKATNEDYLVWQGELSSFQQKIALQLEQSQSKEQLLHAVTGAGKTEMIFRYLNIKLKAGLRVAYTAPRIDVVIEIGKRLRIVFPSLQIPILYSNSTEKYFLSQLTVLTLQQLVRFERCFDVIIVDEVDAFPYADNAFLERQVKKALTNKGQILYLTATLTQTLKQFAGEIHHLPLRYHLKPLPVPRYYFLYKSFRYLQRQSIPFLIKRLLQQQKNQLLIFFPNIKQMQAWTQLLQRTYPKQRIAAVFSEDSKRETKIEQMRNHEIDILCTTTILERGVTFKGIDVWIFDAHHRVFNKQSIVQIAGRVGRTKEKPDGNIYLIAEGKTEAISSAINEIKYHNREGKKLLNGMSNL